MHWFQFFVGANTNWIDKNLHNRALQGIISGKKKYSHLLGYDEPLNDKRNAFEKVKVRCI